ncbi:hypothetical protein DSO57_1010458 [Entomophthora muscae]|uniref:Uncharacterized protein n=1 Tax=Entomophthora muscae TaxID=34485 RepID=A0ACC2TUP5_9FUNG|nr:hypothetical protein DSO57_1010458 [Entomophthora muscae]
MCDNLDLPSSDLISLIPAVKGVSSSPSPQLEINNPVFLQVSENATHIPSWVPWLLTGLVLMGLNTYLPQLSLMSFLWSPLRVAIPLIHWMAVRIINFNDPYNHHLVPFGLHRED